MVKNKLRVVENFLVSLLIKIGLCCDCLKSLKIFLLWIFKRWWTLWNHISKDCRGTLKNQLNVCFNPSSMWVQNFAKRSSSGDESKEESFGGGRKLTQRGRYSKDWGRNNVTRRNSGEIFNKSYNICKKNEKEIAISKETHSAFVAKDLAI